MAIIGGAVITPLQGAFVDSVGTANSNLLPFACLIVIGIDGISSKERRQLRRAVA